MDAEDSLSAKLPNLQKQVGGLLANGKLNEEILDALQVGGLSPDEARRVLRSVYDSWASVQDLLNIQAEDNRNWHQFMRMRLLQKTLGAEAIASWNLSLRILDSLAAVQGISTLPISTVPLPILLVEKAPTESTPIATPVEEI